MCWKQSLTPDLGTGKQERSVHRERMEDPHRPRVFPPRAGLSEPMREPRGGFGGSLKSWGWRSLGRALMERSISSEDGTQMGLFQSPENGSSGGSSPWAWMEDRHGKLVFGLSAHLTLLILLLEPLPSASPPASVTAPSESLSLAPVVHSSNLLLMIPLWALPPSLIRFLQNK